MTCRTLCGYVSVFAFQLGVAFLTDHIIYPAITGLIIVGYAAKRNEEKLRRQMRSNFFYHRIPPESLERIDGKISLELRA